LAIEDIKSLDVSSIMLQLRSNVFSVDILLVGVSGNVSRLAGPEPSRVLIKLGTDISAKF
jgi:hypothetical protein